ncbi:hypothetical protein EDB85DRAFT_2277774 [Lactarius pseudohatsudake]|nr:hypothetical protein EDB85DRAFT_2277774 [Lactarius pseudohatsudake]
MFITFASLLSTTSARSKLSAKWTKLCGDDSEFGMASGRQRRVQLAQAAQWTPPRRGRRVLHEGRPAGRMLGRMRFYRRQTSEQGQRGFRLSSLGILLACSLRPRPWRHVPALKALMRDLHSDSVAQGDSSQDVWRRFLELREARLEDLGGAGAWHRWSEELEVDTDDGGAQDGSDGSTRFPDDAPSPPSACAMALLTHAIQVAADTHIHGAVEATSFLCQVVADMCIEDQTTPATQGEPNAAPQLKDRPRLDSCTTDAIFLEKPQYYDLIIESTSYAPTERRTTERPGLQLAIREPYTRRLTFHRALHLERRETGSYSSSTQIRTASRARIVVCALTDALGVYEDVRVVCARLCSGLWRSCNGTGGLRDQWSWTGSPRAPRCAHRDGIKGRRSYRQNDDVTGKYDSSDGSEDGAVGVRSRQTCTMLALLQTFHAQMRFLLFRLATVFPPAASAPPDAQLTPRDLLALALGPLSSPDVRFVKWLAEEYAARFSAPRMARLAWRARGCRCWGFGRSVVVVSGMRVFTMSYLKARTDDSWYCGGVIPLDISQSDLSERWFLENWSGGTTQNVTRLGQMGTVDEIPNASESPASNLNFETIAISLSTATALVRSAGDPLWDICRVNITGRDREVEVYPGKSSQVARIVVEKIEIIC